MKFQHCGPFCLGKNPKEAEGGGGREYSMGLSMRVQAAGCNVTANKLLVCAPHRKVIQASAETSVMDDSDREATKPR